MLFKPIMELWQETTSGIFSYKKNTFSKYIS